MSVFSSGDGYTRFPDVEAEIQEISRFPYSEWLRRKKQLHTEMLVSLTWQIGSDNGEVVGPLVMEVTRRTIRISTDAAQGFDPGATELIVTQVEEKIRELVVSQSPSKERQFLEGSFATAVRRETWKLVDKYKNSPIGGLRADVPIDMGVQNDDDGEETNRPSLQVVDESDGPDAVLLSFEDERIRGEIIESLYKMVKNPRNAEALMLVHGHGYTYEEAALALGVTLGQIEYSLKRGLAAVREKLGVEI